MKVFVSWSGDRSKSVASALKTWLSDALPSVEAWMSAHDIHAGNPWTNELHQRLRDSEFGILCLTPKNLAAPWLLYEAGALIMSVKPGYVVPYLIGVDPGDVKQPLSQLQGVAADRDGTFRLLESLNEAGERPLPAERLKKTFDKWWPDLEHQFALPTQARVEGGIGILAPQSNIFDESEMQRFRTGIVSLIERDVNRIVIDCSALPYITSNVLGALTFAVKRSRSTGGEIALAGMTPAAKEVIAVTHFDKILASFDTVEEAIRHVRDSRD